MLAAIDDASETLAAAARESGVAGVTETGADASGFGAVDIGGEGTAPGAARLTAGTVGVRRLTVANFDVSRGTVVADDAAADAAAGTACPADMAGEAAASATSARAVSARSATVGAGLTTTVRR